jgi:phosphate-selective porin
MTRHTAGQPKTVSPGRERCSEPHAPWASARGAGPTHQCPLHNLCHYEARPESHLAPFLVDTGDIQAKNASQLGLETAYVNGPFSLQGELTGSWIADTDSGSRTLWGAYVYASWFLTGEHRVYDRAAGVFGRLAPEKNLFQVRLQLFY